MSLAMGTAMGLPIGAPMGSRWGLHGSVSEERKRRATSRGSSRPSDFEERATARLEEELDDVEDAPDFNEPLPPDELHRPLDDDQDLDPMQAAIAPASDRYREAWSALMRLHAARAARGVAEGLSGRRFRRNIEALKGTVKAIVKNRGLGFIQGEDGVEYFFHAGVVVSAWSELNPRDQVSFMPGPGSRRALREAHGVQRIEVPG